MATLTFVGGSLDLVEDGAAVGGGSVLLEDGVERLGVQHDGVVQVGGVHRDLGRRRGKRQVRIKLNLSCVKRHKTCSTCTLWSHL